MNGLAIWEWCDAELGSEIERVVGFSPRAGQNQAIRKLVIDRKDLILVAPTGWGKSVVFQATPALAAGICLMIMPLTLLVKIRSVLYFVQISGLTYRGILHL
jgi:superfamily II DNA helicase RecQ